MGEGVSVLVFDTAGGRHWLLRCVLPLVYELNHALDNCKIIFR